MESHIKTWNWWICDTTWICINFEIFLIEISRNKQAINKRFQKDILNECWSINLYLFLRLRKKWLPFLHLFTLFQMLKLSLKFVSQSFIYRVSVVIFAGASFCSLCQNLGRPQKLFQFPRGMYFSLKSFLTFFRLPKAKNPSKVKTNWWRKLFLWWKLCAWKGLR